MMLLLTFMIGDLVESITSKALAPFVQHIGCPVYLPRMMLKIILCGSHNPRFQEAKFMRMKDDYKQNGQLKGGYNMKIAIEDQFTLEYDVYPNPNDTKTLISFLDKIEQEYFGLPKNIVADDLLNNRKRTLLITYNQY